MAAARTLVATFLSLLLRVCCWPQSIAVNCTSDGFGSQCVACEAVAQGTNCTATGSSLGYCNAAGSYFSCEGTASLPLAAACRGPVHTLCRPAPPSLLHFLTIARQRGHAPWGTAQGPQTAAGWQTATTAPTMPATASSARVRSTRTPGTRRTTSRHCAQVLSVCSLRRCKDAHSALDDQQRLFALRVATPDRLCCVRCREDVH